MAALANTLPLTRSSVQSAHDLIKSHIHRTPVLTNTTLSTLASTPQTAEALIGTPFEGCTPARPRMNLFFKCENYQKVGAFKFRGASHALARLSDEELQKGVVTHSSGNHAQALALAARMRGIPAYIVMPTISTPSKIAATRGYGANIIFSGSTSQERESVVADVIARTGALLVPPYDHPDIILGQGTVALEMEEQVAAMVARDPSLSVHHDNNNNNNNKSIGNTTGVPTNAAGAATNNSTGPKKPRGKPHPGILDAIIAPLGGGGLLSGIATALTPTRTLVYGAEPSLSGADDARRALASPQQPRKRITHVSSLTIADGLRTPVGEIPWSVICEGELVAGVFAVSEGQILEAMQLLLERGKVVVEPSAGVGLAVVLWDEGFRRVVEGWGRADVGVVISGGNVGVEALAGLFAGGRGGEVGLEREMGMVGLDGGREVQDVAG